MGWAVVRLYGFRLTQVAEDLRIEYGFVHQVHGDGAAQAHSGRDDFGGTTLPAVAARLPVRVDTAGGRTGQEGTANAREWLAPLLRRNASSR